MAGEQRLFIGARSKIGQEKIIYKTDARVQQRAIAGSAVAGDSALQEGAHVVEFVAPLLDFRLHSLPGMIAAIIRVQVSVPLFRGNDVLRGFLTSCANLGALTGFQSRAS